MPARVIENLPEELHRKLKEQAARQHRSMTGEAVALLEEALAHGGQVPEAPPPYRGAFSLAQDIVDDAKRQGRW